jgi:hypothetical protein
VTRAGTRPGGKSRAAVLVGLAVSFVVAIDAIRLCRADLLVDPEPSWTPLRLFLGLFVIAVAAGAAALGSTVFWLWARRLGSREPVALPFSAPVLLAVAVAAISAGVLLRFVELDRRPAWLFVDDLSLVSPTLALKGSVSDFRDSIRPVPFGVPKLFGTVGVAYLEGFRVVLRRFGTTVFGLRFLSALAGCVSLLTAALLGRALLPKGGATLTALVLAGLRWHLILSRWAWNMIVLAPLVDVGTLLLLRARRRASLPASFLAGAVIGLCAHVYLSAWIAAAALLGLSVWPGEPPLDRRTRVSVGAVFLAGLAVVVMPLFLFHENRMAPYFARTGDHNMFREIRYTGSFLPVLSAAADGLAGPWLTADPSPRQDIPGRSRLGWILGIPVLVALTKTLLSPRRELSGLLLLHSGTALAATVVGGQAGTPNGARFGYLTTVAALAAAMGILLLLSFVPGRQRRQAALAALGVLAISGALGARDALQRWPERAETFGGLGFHGQDTLIGRAALRWGYYGSVELSPDLVHSPVAYETIRRFGLDPDVPAGQARHVGKTERIFRVAAPEAPAKPGERVVERISDPWGKNWAVVLGEKRPDY